ncbi:Protein O-glucosyltransferase 2 [Polyplax serrata]|uniref:Protein O-glucosyltransferase 2 n=1 Tax=Polyplax serrata TaxID=468196 RepID=A0ABR1B0X9_POLSC
MFCILFLNLRVARDMLSVQGNTGANWNSKTNKAFWRGRDSSLERLKLVELSRKYPDIINASLTHFFFFRDKEKEYGPTVDSVPFFDFFQYKYQINLDGTVAAYRLPFLLAGDSVVLKQDSPYYEHFYKELVPYVHYMPFKKDLSNLVDAIKWLQQNDTAAQSISHQAQEFVRNNLMPKDIFCYYVTLFKVSEIFATVMFNNSVSPKV